MLSHVAFKDDKQRGSAMKSKLLTAVIAAAFMTVSGASWAYVGGNTIVKYPNADASKNPGSCVAAAGVVVAARGAEGDHAAGRTAGENR